MTRRLADRVAIITGAARGIGAATARLFGDEGAHVIAVDLPGEERERAVADLTSECSSISFNACDVTCPNQVEGLVEATLNRHGRIDVLFNNAGYNLVKTVDETTDDEYDLCLDVNLRAVFNGCRAILPVMRRQRAGVILSTASSAGLVGRPALPVYAAAKAGVVLLTKSLALAVGPHGIRVNCICPGSVRTPMFEEAIRQLPDPEATAQRVADTCALRRLCTPEEIAHAALFLASDEARYITGVALPVDGGRTAGVQEAEGGFDQLAGLTAGARR